MSIREQIQEELDATRNDFHQLLAAIPPETYDLPSGNPSWTIREVLFHMSLAPRMLGTDVRLILRGGWLSRLVPALIPRKVFDWINLKFTKYGARRATPEFLALEYDKAHQAALHVLAKVGDSDFEKMLVYPGWDPLLSGQVTLERLFHYVRLHFNVHAEQIRDILNADRSSLK